MAHLWNEIARLQAEAGGALLCVRLGAFLELFDVDAEVASRVLDIRIGRRGDRAMCGFPAWSRPGDDGDLMCVGAPGLRYLAMLTEAGYPVVVAEPAGRDAAGRVQYEVVAQLEPDSDRRLH